MDFGLEANEINLFPCLIPITFSYPPLILFEIHKGSFIFQAEKSRQFKSAGSAWRWRTFLSHAPLIPCFSPELPWQSGARCLSVTQRQNAFLGHKVNKRSGLASTACCFFPLLLFLLFLVNEGSIIFFSCGKQQKETCFLKFWSSVLLVSCFDFSPRIVKLSKPLFFPCLLQNTS